MDRLRAIYSAFLVILSALVVFLAYHVIGLGSGGITLATGQEFAVLGGEVIGGFTIRNSGEESRVYTYALYINDQRRFRDSVVVNSGRRFQYIWHHLASTPGEVKVNIVISERDQEKSVENVTYYVTVVPGKD